MKTFSGVLIKCITTNRVLLLLRATPPHEGSWSILAGENENGETQLEGLKREVGEELSINPDIIRYEFVSTELTHKGDMFYYYKGFVEDEFIPTIDEENLDFGWFEKDKLPEPQYPNLDAKVKNI
jgi:ADP-ribose pyrophosphatase YjhB (NUDIX family)